ncbi:MAG: ABC transporter permease [Coriobacteriaceae bacterium]|nr:ABC transporter permease [Coriobacteriaceae bacterium]
MTSYMKYVVKRVANYVVMIFIATSLTYLLAASFLNARSNYESRTPRPPQASIEQSLDAANLNDKTPLWERYTRWLGGVVQGDWGVSPTGRPVASELAGRIGNSVKLLAISAVLSVVIGVSLGVYTAQRQYMWQDRALSGMASFLLVVPTVVLAILIVFFAIDINNALPVKIFYVTGLSSYSGDNIFLAFLDFLQHITLPTLVLTIISAVGYHLNQRTYLLDEMHADYVRTARAKGLTKRQAIRKHALRASLIPTSVGVAFSIAGIFTGAVMTEKIFAVHGLGEYFINCINNNDVNGAVAVAAFSGVCTLAGALLADLFAVALDPRIRMS